MTPHWRIDLFGGLRATSGDRVVSRFRTHKAGALLAYLAYYRGRSHLREVLIELLWPESPPSAGRCNLRTELCYLRAQLEPMAGQKGAVLVADRTSVQLDPSACSTDVAEFEAAVQAARMAGSAPERERQLFRAMALYQGELLPGFFEDWALLERQWLSEAACQAQRELSSHFAQALDLPAACPSSAREAAEAAARGVARRNMVRLQIEAAQTDGALRGTHPDEEVTAGWRQAHPATGDAVEMQLWQGLQQAQSCMHSLQAAIREMQATLAGIQAASARGRGKRPTD